jgi:hypothetical protein
MADRRPCDRRQFAQGGRYHIRVRGHLDECWADWFEGFQITSRDNGSTLLRGVVVDQAALHGVLDRIHGLGLPLLLVVQADLFCANESCPILSGLGPDGTHEAE